MQKIQDSVFSIVKTTNLSPAVFSFLQPSDEFEDKTPLGGILKDTKYGWLALGPKFCVVDLRTGLKVAARTFGATLSNNTSVTCVVELPKPLTENSQQLVISLQCDDIGMICVLHINGSQILRCMQTDVVVTELAVCDRIPDGPFTCFDGLVVAGTKRGEIFAFDLNRASLIQALKDISQGYEHLVQNESNPTSLSFLPLNAIRRIEEQRELALENDHHLAILLNENSMVDGQYIFRNPDGTVRMKAKRDHIRVTVLQYIPQLGSMAVGFNFGAFQLWNLMTLDLEFTSQVNVECLPVTHFAFQEPCDDPRAFCYLWVVFSVIDRYEEEEFPLAVMYSLTYQGKRMLSDTKYLYQDFSTATIRFQVELSTMEESALLGGKCISCHSYSIKSILGDEGEDSMLNICQLVWECWGENANSPMQYGMLLFDLDQWYKDQMPSTYHLESNTFMAATWCSELAGRGSVTLHARIDPSTVCPYLHATRLEEHFYPNSLQYNCICLNTSEALTLRTVGVQRSIISSLEGLGGAALLRPARLHAAAARAGLALSNAVTEEDQRRSLLSVALEARLSRFLKRCAHDWATGSHAGVGCTLPFLVDWAWKRALELKENAKELTAPLFATSALPDGNVVRCLDHSVQQLAQLTGLMDAVLTKCCNMVVPAALSEMEEVHVGIGCVSLYFRVVQWFLRVGLLPERSGPLPYPHQHLTSTFHKRRLKLNRLQDSSNPDENANKSCSLLYIDQLIEHEFGGEKIHQMWMKAGSENGLYPPPSLYSLLRLYLMPELPEEHKHSLVLYLLLDYSMLYDDVRYEAVIRRLMQFPTMFGLSNTAIKATQAFWHLDHRDFDFALDQLQCLTANSLSEWQHEVVLSSLLAQKKSQAALQYLHVRKPPPQNNEDNHHNHRLNESDHLSEWQSCCSLYLSRGLVHAALDVVRECAHNAATHTDKTHVLHYFFKGCRNTGNLSKVLQLTLMPDEEEVFIKYLENCNEPQTSDLLIMFFLQQSRYLEAERYNNKLKRFKPQRNKDINTSMDSLFDSVYDRDGARDALVEVVCSALPTIANTVAKCASKWNEIEPHVMNAPQPLSVFVQTKSPRNTFTYKSSFIQDTIENASETWMNRPKMRKGLKRALEIDETPFICTPKLMRTKSVFANQQSEATPPKRARLSVSNTPKTPKNASFRVSEKLSKQMEKLLDMPEIQSPVRVYRSRAETPHSILKIRRNSRDEAASPAGSRYLCDSDDELLETASNHTHYSDSTNKHLRFTIPTASEAGSTPSPLHANYPQPEQREKDAEMAAAVREREMDVSTDSYCTTTSHAMNENNQTESPPKILEPKPQPRRSFKDTVRARRSLSISANSSLSEDPNTSIESIADIPITLINPRYSGERKRTTPSPLQENMSENLDQSETNEQNIGQSAASKDIVKQILFRSFETKDDTVEENRDAGISTLSSKELRSLEQPRFSVQDVEYKKKEDRLEVPRTPRGRRGIRSVGESTPVINRSRSGTPERQDSPAMTPLRSRITRSRSRSKTPELSPRSSPLAPIPEQPKQERESETHEHTNIVVPRQVRSRSKTPERMEVGVSESPRLEVIKESPTKSSDSPVSSPTRRSLRSRSRTPEVEIVEPAAPASPRTQRSRSKTPEKLMSPKKEHTVRTKKSLSRIVLEQNTFAKTKQTLESLESEITESRSETVIECTPMKPLKQTPGLMDVTLSPIVNKSPSTSKEGKTDDDNSDVGLKTLPAFTLHETYFEKSVLKSYQSSVEDVSKSAQDIPQTDKTVDSSKIFKPLGFTTINETDFNKSVLNSYVSSVAESDNTQEPETKDDLEKQKLAKLPNPFAAFASMIETDFSKSVLKSHESSAASPDVSKNANANVSSLITNDSDSEIRETETESQDTAVRKEKEKIVEIEREINEIEGEMNEIGDESESSEGSGMEESGEESSGENEEDSDTSSGETSPVESDAADESSEAEVISIDSKSDETIDSDINPDSDANPEKQWPLTVFAPNTQDMKERVEKVEEQQQKEKEQVSQNVDKSEGAMDPLTEGQVSLMTDDNSVVESDQSMVLNYSDDQEKQDEMAKEGAPVEIQVEVVTEIPSKVEAKGDEPKATSSDVVDASAPKVDAIEPMQVETITSQQKEKQDEMEVEKPDTDKTKPGDNTTKTAEEDKSKETVEIKELESESVKPATRTKKRAKSTSSNKSTKETEIDKDKEDGKTKETLPLIQEIKENEGPRTPVTRKRAHSNASAKSKSEKVEAETKVAGDVVKEGEEKQQEIEEPKTPARRKRANSNASKTEDKTPEQTPSRRRARTPTSAEVRKIITRRVSREMGLLDKSNDSLDDSFSLTPKRRTMRTKSKTMDDNESVASESSVISNKSKTEDVDVKPVRKGRKSVLATKPDLSVIPEVITEESKDESLAVAGFSGTRKKGRTLSTTGAASSPRGRRRASTTSRASQSTVNSEVDEEPLPGFDVEPIDRISLLNKTDFEGSPDTDELPNISPESVTSDTTAKRRRSRMVRAVSESRPAPAAVRAAKIGRRIASVDVAESSDLGSPVPSSTDSPQRGRRASFNRAVEALLTPKGRRTSTDLRSPAASPAPSDSEGAAPAPARRTRRASTHSNTSQTKADTGKRTKKMPVLEEEDKETKK